MNAIVKVENVGMSFETKKGRFVALQNVELQIGKGEVVSLIGHSGCGKSTLLNLIAGLTLPTSGVMLCNGREIAGPGPERAVVFQNHSLLPWLNCFENVHLAVERCRDAPGARHVAGDGRQRAQPLGQLPVVEVGDQVVEGQQVATEAGAGNAPISEELRTKVQAAIDTIK